MQCLIKYSIGKMFYFCSPTEYVDQMVMNVNTKNDICPTFNAIVEKLDENSLQERQNQSSQDSVCDVTATDDITGESNRGSEFTGVNDADDDKGCELDDGSYGNADAWSYDHNDDADHAHDSFDTSNQHLENQYEVSLACSVAEIFSFDILASITKNVISVSGKTKIDYFTKNY